MSDDEAPETVRDEAWVSGTFGNVGLPPSNDVVVDTDARLQPEGDVRNPGRGLQHPA